MRGIGRIGGIALVMATVWAAAVTDAIADPGEATHIDELAAVVDGDTITVSGQATFVDVPVLVGQDGTGDAVPDGGLLPLGHDLTTATIGRPDPFGETLTFTLGVANPPPTANGVPQVVVYQWPLRVGAAGVFDTFLDLEAFADSLSACPENPGIGPCFRVIHYTGALGPFIRTGDIVAEVPGTMGGGIVRWEVPLSALGAEPGSGIERPRASVRIRATVASASSTSFAAVFLDSVPPSQDYRIPAPVVRVGAAPAGTPPAEVALTTAAAIQDGGGFTASMPAPSTPGEHLVVAEACYGEGTCALASTTVTIP